MAVSIDVAITNLVYWALEKNQRKTNKTARFSWFWALFVIKQWSRMDWNSPNASGVGPQSCYNCRGFQNLSLLSVSGMHINSFVNGIFGNISIFKFFFTFHIPSLWIHWILKMTNKTLKVVRIPSKVSWVKIDTKLWKNLSANFFWVDKIKYI